MNSQEVQIRTLRSKQLIFNHFKERYASALYYRVGVTAFWKKAEGKMNINIKIPIVKWKTIGISIIIFSIKLKK